MKLADQINILINIFKEVISNSLLKYVMIYISL